MTETNSEESRPRQFELIAGNVCLDLVNTLDDRPSGEPKELLKTFYDLVKFGQETGILTTKQLDYFFENAYDMPENTEYALNRARNFREALYQIFSAFLQKEPAPHAAIERVNANIQTAALHSWLWQNEGRCVWRFDDMTSDCISILWPIARAAAALLTSPHLAMVRACSSPTCQWLYLDTSKNHQRRWCSMKQCGNRAKVRSFYARKRESAENR